MIVSLRMLAFADGKIREVEIPDPDADASIETVLESVFYYGQNDIQPKPFPSVSVGDVVEYGGQLWMVKPLGFAPITADEVEKLATMDRKDFLRSIYG